MLRHRDSVIGSSLLSLKNARTEVRDLSVKPIAVFDLDGTFVRSSLLIEIVRGLVREGVFPPLAEKELELAYRAWRERRGSYQDHIMQVVEVFHRRIRGCSVHDVEYVGDMVAEEQHDQVYVYTRELIQRLRETHHLVAITGSPDVVVKPFAEAWGFVRVYPSTLVVRDGVYTGGREPPMDQKFDISEFKRGFLRDAMRVDMTLKGSVGVGDTESDAVFLEAVEQPIAFNPNVNLVRIAQANEWEMVYERKDAIVHLRDGKYSIEGVA